MAERAPFWPAMMKRATAARYCELTVAEFEREVADDRLPEPVMLGNHEHWSRARLDQALDQLHGGADDWRKAAGIHRAA